MASGRGTITFGLLFLVTVLNAGAFGTLGGAPRRASGSADPEDAMSERDRRIFKEALSKAERAVRCIEDLQEFNRLLERRDYRMLEFIGRVLLQSRIYNSGVDFAHLIHESAYPFKGDLENLKKLKISVLGDREFERKLQTLQVRDAEREEAFYVPGENTAYFRGRSVTHLVKFMALLLHEAVHAYLPDPMGANAAMAEAITIRVLDRALRLNENNPAFLLIAHQCTKDLMERIRRGNAQGWEAGWN